MSIKSIKEIKRHVLALIEEYTVGDNFTSEDDDINIKMLPLINLHYIFLANQTGILKKKVINAEGDMNEQEGYTSYSVSPRCAKLIQVEVIKGSKRDIDYYYLNKRLYIKNDFCGTVEVTYNAYPEDLTEIDSSMVDKTELELSEDAVLVLCYQVAGDMLKTDVSANYTAFESKAEKIISAIDIDKSNIIGVVKNIGYIGGL